ncbi:MAG: hypothetical protein SLAVMIC_00420 [uncultured marine phage]|uniref:Uncharacterized protein n=1 Tax=uncultured marine phage TaxID=707152 RepID=A0A8D9FRI9_9VIRU|nr:MAG: hypothetical protein SLAVMIC_00420 [uncultured marine phage]
MRLNQNCETFEEAFKYFEERTIQLYADGYIVRHIEPISNIGTLATFFKGDKEYHSFYLYASKRGKGIYSKLVKEYDWNIITSQDCGLEPFFRKYNRENPHDKIKFTMALGFHDYEEYKTISNHYGNDTAKRSGVPFMNHIDEGLAILKWIGASLEAKKAYCLHPIYQSDESLKENGHKNYGSIFGFQTPVLVNTMEYRNIANNYLSSNTVSDFKDIKLSPLKDVNDMLVADKIQNMKDFEIYHKGTHPKSENLDKYFKNWLRKLGVTVAMYEEFKNRLNIKSQII